MKATIDKCKDAERQLATLREQYRNEHPYCKNYACKNNSSLNKNVCLLYNYYADECKDYVEEEPTTYKPNFKVEDFKPFDCVIVRSKDSGKRAVWQTALFSHLEQDTYDGKVRRRYVASNERWDFCLPHKKETDALIGTNLPYDGFYRTW